VAGAFILAAAVGLIATPTSAREVTVRDRDVRVSDVATIAGASQAVRDVVIARLPSSGTERVLTGDQLAQLIRHALPGATVVGALQSSITIRSAAPAPQHAEMAPYVPPSPLMHRGDKLALTSSSDVIRIERPVVALQDASASAKRVFVRTGDGQVFAAPLGGER
jgi:hypothetical protein